MDWIHQLFAKEDQLNSWWMCARGILVFLTALVLLRIGGKRTFGKESPVDHVVVIMLGGILSRVVTGAAAFFPVMLATFAILLVHRLLAWLCMKYPAVDAVIKGRKKLLYTNDKPQEENMRQTLVSMEDLEEGVRMTLNEDGTNNAKHIYIETNGHLSVVKKTNTAS